MKVRNASRKLDLRIAQYRKDVGLGNVLTPKQLSAAQMPGSLKRG